MSLQVHADADCVAAAQERVQSAKRAFSLAAAAAMHGQGDAAIQAKNVLRELNDALAELCAVSDEEPPSSESTMAIEMSRAP